MIGESGPEMLRLSPGDHVYQARIEGNGTVEFIDGKPVSDGWVHSWWCDGDLSGCQFNGCERVDDDPAA
jgi:hypothetical protein